MQLTSPDFVSGGEIPRRLTCDGKNERPTLIIGGVPNGTCSMVLIVESQDAHFEIFTHWIVWNIRAKTEKLEPGLLPEDSKEGLNSLGIKGYTGPYTKTGTHDYIFTIYALDMTLDNFDQNQSLRSQLFDAMTGHILATAELVGLYRKNK